MEALDRFTAAGAGWTSLYSVPVKIECYIAAVSGVVAPAIPLWC